MILPSSTGTQPGARLPNDQPVGHFSDDRTDVLILPLHSLISQPLSNINKEKLSNEDVKRIVDKNFDRIDADQDGLLSKEELEKASQDPSFQGEDKEAVNLLKKHREELEELSNDELGDENDGITRADLDKYEWEALDAEEQELVRAIADDLSKSPAHRYDIFS